MIMTDMFNERVSKADRTCNDVRIDEVVPGEPLGSAQAHDNQSQAQGQVDGLIYSHRLHLTLKNWAKLNL